MTPEEFAIICDKLSGRVDKFAISCAFEPLIHPHFVDFLPHLKKLGSCQIRLNTNGIKLNEKNIISMIESELDHIIVSLDAPSAELNERIRGHSKFHHIIQKIQRLHEIKASLGVSKPDCTIRFTLLKKNLYELPQMVLLVKSIGVTSLIVRHVLPIEGCSIEGSSMFEQSCLLCPKETEFVFNQTRELARQNKINVDLPPPRPIPDSSELDKHCEPIFRGFHIFPDGNCYPCVWLTHYPVCENILTDDIERILSAKSILQLRNRFESGNLTIECLTCLKDTQNIGIKKNRNAHVVRLQS